jgi:thiosulfate reductase cytochrome b subunit
MAPLIWVTGLLYMFYNDWQALGLAWLDLSVVAALHTLGAFLLLIFLVGHMYLITTGHTVFAHMKAMITGWDEQEEDIEVEGEKAS